MSEENFFKHDINRIIEGCAEALEKKMGFNQSQVILKFQFFPMDFFSNTPHVPDDEIDDWYYLRDSRTHGAVIYNYNTQEIRLIEISWNDKNLEEFRLTNEEIEERERRYEKKMKKIIRTLAYRKLKPVILWYFKCPLGFVRMNILKYSPIELITEILKKYAEQFDLISDDYKGIARDLFDAKFFEEGLTEPENDRIVLSSEIFKDDGVYIGAESFRNPQDLTTPALS